MKTKENITSFMKKIKLYNLVSFLIIILNLVMLSYISLYFYTGFHNIDLGFNMEVNLGKDYLDLGSDNTLRSGKDLYMLGLKQIKESYLKATFLICANIILFIFLKDLKESDRSKK